MACAMFDEDDHRTRARTWRPIAIALALTACATCAGPDGASATPGHRDGEVARPGVWAGEEGADLRKLTQEQTDALIRGELIRSAPAAERAALIRDYGEPREVVVRSSKPAGMSAACHVQRGGLDSDPRVRALAHRAWGDRDARWFALRGVHKGEGVMGGPLSPVSPVRRHQMYDGRALQDGRPGDVIEIDYGPIGTAWVTVGDGLREEPASR
jgi:hypothetical protein